MGLYRLKSVLHGHGLARDLFPGSRFKYGFCLGKAGVEPILNDASLGGGNYSVPLKAAGVHIKFRNAIGSSYQHQYRTIGFVPLTIVRGVDSAD